MQILISEASYLIWVIRCERAIHVKEHTAQEIETRWKKKINERLTTDKIIATKIKRMKHAGKLANATWEEALKKQGLPYEDCIHRLEVF